MASQREFSAPASPQSERHPLTGAFCDEFRRIAGTLVGKADADSALVGACAAHTGIQFMLRDFASDQVAAWLEREAAQLRSFGDVQSLPIRPQSATRPN